MIKLQTKKGKEFYLKILKEKYNINRNEAIKYYNKLALEINLIYDKYTKNLINPFKLDSINIEVKNCIRKDLSKHRINSIINRIIKEKKYLHKESKKMFIKERFVIEYDKFIDFITTTIRIVREKDFDIEIYHERREVKIIKQETIKCTKAFEYLEQIEREFKERDYYYENGKKIKIKKKKKK